VHSPFKLQSASVLHGTSLADATTSPTASVTSNSIVVNPKILTYLQYLNSATESLEASTAFDFPPARLPMSRRPVPVPLMLLMLPNLGSAEQPPPQRAVAQR
jgi:hypothetical protein